ncbi:MAG: LacI family transcriptional regulator [Verrucomicrobiales bacterium]|nr:LacI family transcriptional regulator [Verrucomicrobiales bacterium]
MKNPTMTDVAERAGVSHATVSRIVNGRPGVSAQAEAAVRDAMAELQYLAPPSSQRPGRNPNTKRLQRHIAFLTFDRAFAEHSSFVASVYEGARRAAMEKDFVVSLLSLDGYDSVPDWIHPRNLDGLLLQGLRSRSHLTRTAEEIPSLWLTTHGDGHEDSVLPGNEKVGEIAARYLQAQGHQRVAAIGVEPDNPSYRVRIDSFVAAAKKLGMKVQSLSPTKRELEIQDGRQRMENAVGKVLSRPKRDRPTALFLPSDYMTAQAHFACRKLGATPGKDFAFVSCDNEAAYLEGLFPRPVTIDLGTEARGRLAFQMLLSRIEDPSRDRRATLLLDPVLVEG